MKKLIFIISAAVTCATIFAAPERKPLTQAEKAALQEKRLLKTGGVITKEGKGKVLFINAQSKFSDIDISNRVKLLKDQLKVNMETRRGEWKFNAPIPSDASIALYVVDDKSLPMSLVAMEAKWGIVNVAPLTTKKQFERELLRVAIATFSAFSSQYKVSPMQTIQKPEDLDALVGDALTVDAALAMRRNFEAIGITQSRMTSYRKACQEGWANAPTNKYQQAVWDEVRTLPTAPLKLTK